MKPLARILYTAICATLATIAGLPAAADGISGSGIIKYFHSVVIDGVHYQTEDAVIRINGEPAAEHDLKVGYHVSYRADRDSLQTWSMDYYDTVAGTVEAVSISDPELQVARIQILGQSIATDADTWFHGVELVDIEAGMALAISAEWLPDGTLLASSVDAAPRSEQILSGRIDAIDGRILWIGGIRIDAANIGLELNGESLQVGEWIHGFGLYNDAGTLYATRLVRQADRDIAELPARMEGVLRLEQGSWRIRDQLLQLSADQLSTLRERLRPGARVAVRGTLTPAGLLFAKQVRVQPQGVRRLDGVIEEIRPDGTAISVGGRMISLDERSSFRDDRDGYRWLGPEDLAVHDAVSLIIEEQDGVLRARKIVRLRTAARVLRATIEDTDWRRGPMLLQQRLGTAYSAREAFYNGRKVAPWRLRWLLRRGDAMTLRWDDRGRIVRAEAQSAVQE